MIYLFPTYPRPLRRLLHSAVHVHHVHVHHVHAVINQTTVVHVPSPATGVAEWAHHQKVLHLFRVV